MQFSERMGFVPVKQLIQIDYMDEALRTSLWNSFYVFIWRVELQQAKTSKSSPLKKEAFENLSKITAELWYSFFKLPLNQIPPSLDDVLEYLEMRYFKFEWYQVYDFIEFIAKNFTFLKMSASFKNECNQILEREKSAYRFVNNTLTKITNEQEIMSIEKAIRFQDNRTFVNMHIQQALSLMTDRNKPDYINSIKESISAVESICKVIIEDDGDTLGKALNKLEQKGIVIQSTLKEGFKRIYWYTSDNDGIRHAHKDAPNVSYEDAQFMLIICSAFCNYLAEKANRVGISIS